MVGVMNEWTSSRARTPRSEMHGAPVDVRNAGLTLIPRVNKWLTAGAIGVSGLLSLVAAHAFHGRTLKPSSAASAVRSTARHAQASSDGDGGSSLRQPAQAPAAAAPAQSPVVSGGS